MLTTITVHQIHFTHFSGPDVYFSGGYITQRHGGKEGIDCIQLEIPRDLRFDGGEEGRKQVGHALGKAISEFHHFHYKTLNPIVEPYTRE